MTTAEFIEKYRNDDVKKLALTGAKFPDVDMTFALNQIAGWQTAREKLPAWAAHEGIVYPPRISMEQCSSEHTAKYKADIVRRIVSQQREKASPTYEDCFIDITGGFGVDFSYMAKGFSKAVYVERQEHLCEIATKNFEALGLNHAEVVCGDGTEFINTMKPLIFAYLDPARRDSHGARTYALEDCTPNILELKNTLLEKAQTVMVKLSPMIDWHKTLVDLGCVTELHIVSVKNECKELLVVMSKEEEPHTEIFCVNDDEIFHFSDTDDISASSSILSDAVQPGNILYEPNVSLMKAGCFGLLCERFGVKKIGVHSNLLISDETVDFPGRRFKIMAVSSMNKKEMKSALSGISKANIAVRNFPLTAEELRKRLKLKDGGEHYLFGTTDSANNHIILICNKV